MPNVIKFPASSNKENSFMTDVFSEFTIVGEEGFSDWRTSADSESSDSTSMAVAA